MALVSVAFLAGCVGGSGSSGFDVLESAAISRVTEEQQCESFDGLLICPADPMADGMPTPTAAAPAATATATSSATATEPHDFPSPPPTPTAAETAGPSGTQTPPGFATATPTAQPATPTATMTPTSVPSPGIVTGVAESDFAEPCAPLGASSCAVQFQFSPVGFSAEAAFRVASRLVGAEVPWDIADPLPLSGAGAPFAYAAALPVDPAAPSNGAPQPELQVVVLAFERDPGPVPDRVTRLSDTGADLAFAVTPFAIALQ